MDSSKHWFINMLTDLVESVRKTDEKMKPMLRETKGNVQGTNSDGKETRTQIRRKKETSNQKRMKKQEFKNMTRGLGTSRTPLNIPTSESLGCQKEKRKSKKVKTYLNK